MQRSTCRAMAWIYWLIVWGAMAGVLAMVVYWTPREETMGDVQKIFYIHLPIAINTFVACLIVFVASVGYLLKRETWWDDLALGAAKVAVLFASIVLLTGMIWGRSAWNTWWQWSPRLTSSLILWLLYVVYLMIRPSIESTSRRAMVSAVYGIIAFLDVPLVYLSTKLLKDIHPPSITLAPAMRTTLLVWFAPVTLLSIGLIVTSFKVNRLQRAVREPDELESEDSQLVTAGGNA